MSGLPDAERLAWLRLARTEGVGPVTFDQLIQRYGSAAAALEALPELARRGGRMGALRVTTEAEALQELADGERQSATLLTAGEPGFPYLLAAIDPPPPVLWALGQSRLLQPSSVAVVGARIASAAGMKFAQQLAADLGRGGQTVVSGLARGIDGAAHKGALTTEASTVAVLGGGLGDIYPPEHAGLYAEIAERGCVISENAPGRRAQAKDFPRRNRIISGLSRAVVVVEAELRSGSLITARLAGEQNRDVFAVPGSPLDPRARGANDLIRNGAGLCESADDILSALRPLHGFNERERPPFSGPADPGDDPRLRERIAGLLSPTPISRDELIRAAEAPASAVMAALLELTLAGRAELLPGGLVVSA